jgi:hypothetical protein
LILATFVSICILVWCICSCLTGLFSRDLMLARIVNQLYWMRDHTIVNTHKPYVVLQDDEGQALVGNEPDGQAQRKRAPELSTSMEFRDFISHTKRAWSEFSKNDGRADEDHVCHIFYCHLFRRKPLQITWQTIMLKLTCVSFFNCCRKRR